MHVRIGQGSLQPYTGRGMPGSRLTTFPHSGGKGTSSSARGNLCLVWSTTYLVRFSTLVMVVCIR